MVGLAYDQAKNQNMIDFSNLSSCSLLLTKCSQMLTHFIDATLPVHKSIKELYY
jgi:hypothetical protein